MSYTKNTWNNGDVITKTKLDNIENGIYNNAVTQVAVNAGVASFKNADNTELFTLTLPDGSWNWIGKNATLISNFAEFSVALKDTLYNGWTASTTAKEILSATTLGTISINPENYDYVIKWIFDTDLNYVVGATLKAIPIRQTAISFSQSYRRPRYPSDVPNGTCNYTNITGISTYAPIFLYYATTGTSAVAMSQTYGFYMTPSAPTIASATDNETTMTIQRPVLYARCNSTYFATARAADIDQNNSYLKLKCEVYRVDKDYTAQGILRETLNIINS